MMKFKPECSYCFAGLSCSTRLEIINLLKRKKKLSVLEIAKHFKVSQPTITYHLTYLKNLGILKSKRSGKKNYYSITSRCKQASCGIF